MTGMAGPAAHWPLSGAEARSRCLIREGARRLTWLL
jgi:hypothetical protein